MARGWESKSVEAQQEDAARDKKPASVSPEAAQLASLEMTRARLLQEIEASPHPRFRVLKQRALNHVEAQIAALKPKP